jgi:nucleotide-binding universal stress UspA family protein
MEIPAIKIKKILYATDLSDNALYAFAYAASLAGMYNASITFLNVIEENSNMESQIMSYIGEERWEDIKRKNEADIRNMLTGKIKDHAEFQEVLKAFRKQALESDQIRNCETDEIIVVRGNPVEQIIRQSQERCCDIIVMGTYGHGTLLDAMMGSTARRVLRRSKIPVLVVRLPDEK